MMPPRNHRNHAKLPRNHANGFARCRMVSRSLRNHRETIEKVEKRNHSETGLKSSETIPKPSTKPSPRNRETIPYVHPKRFRSSRARLHAPSERAAAPARSAPLGLRYAYAAPLIEGDIMTKKPPTSRKLVPKPIGPVDKRRRKRGLTHAVRTAIDAMVYDRCTRAEACKRAGFTERALYLAFEKPEVAAYFNKALEVLRAGERPKNIHRLCEIRDAADNMPAVNAIKALMQLDDENAMRSTNAPTPGVVI